MPDRLTPSDDAFLRELFLQNHSDMLRFAAAALSSEDLAQDVVQDTFLVAQLRIDRLRTSKAPRAWLFATLKNIIGRVYKHQKVLYRLLDPGPDRDAAQEPTVPVALEYRGLIDQGELDLLIWVYCEGCSYQQAADRLQISLSACKKRIQRARAHLAEAYQKEFL